MPLDRHVDQRCRVSATTVHRSRGGQVFSTAKADGVVAPARGGGREWCHFLQYKLEVFCACVSDISTDM